MKSKAKEFKGIKYDASSASMLDALKAAEHLTDCKFCKRKGVYGVYAPGMFGEFCLKYFTCEKHKNHTGLKPLRSDEGTRTVEKKD